MKERPILFSGPMVCAILEGGKTQTRRIAKIDADGLPKWGCLYGQPGDRLWVKEKHRVGAWREDGRIAFDYAASPELVNTPWCKSPEEFDFESAWAGWSDYLAAHDVRPDEDGQYHWEPGKSPLPWRPSIFMHRWASRIDLEVTGIRVESLQDIDPRDCAAEGCLTFNDCNHLHDGGIEAEAVWLRNQYRALWESINGPGSWDANPWVWVIEFKRVTP